MEDGRARRRKKVPEVKEEPEDERAQAKQEDENGERAQNSKEADKEAELRARTATTRATKETARARAKEGQRRKAQQTSRADGSRRGCQSAGGGIGTARGEVTDERRDHGRHRRARHGPRRALRLEAVLREEREGPGDLEPKWLRT